MILPLPLLAYHKLCCIVTRETVHELSEIVRAYGGEGNVSLCHNALSTHTCTRHWHDMICCLWACIIVIIQMNHCFDADIDKLLLHYSWIFTMTTNKTQPKEYCYKRLKCKSNLPFSVPALINYLGKIHCVPLQHKLWGNMTKKNRNCYLRAWLLFYRKRRSHFLLPGQLVWLLLLSVCLVCDREMEEG